MLVSFEIDSVKDLHIVAVIEIVAVPQLDIYETHVHYTPVQLAKAQIGTYDP